jgi:hypothetical protein
MSDGDARTFPGRVALDEDLLDVILDRREASAHGQGVEAEGHRLRELLVDLSLEGFDPLVRGRLVCLGYVKTFDDGLTCPMRLFGPLFERQDASR